jgi:hypothetical protein
MSITPSVGRGQTGSAAITAALDDAVRADAFTVATVPTASAHTGKTIYVSNGAAGQPCLAYSNGTAWLRILLGVAVAIS